VEAGRLLGDQRLIGRPQEALLCAKAKRQQMFFLCESVVLTKRQQQQSAQTERKSTTRFGDNPNLLKY